MMSARIDFITSQPSPRRWRRRARTPPPRHRRCAPRPWRSRGPLGCRIFKEMPRLPAFLLLNWPPISESRMPVVILRHIARGAAADRRHRRQPRVGIVLPFDLEAFPPIAARKRVPPAEARNQAKSRILHPLQRKRLVVQRRQPRIGDFARLGRDTGPPCRRAEHRLGILAQVRRAAADLPARLGGEPFASRVAEAPAKLGVLDIGESLAREPMFVERILVRLAQWRPQEAGILRLAPRHVLVGPGADKALHHVEHVRPRLVDAGRARHLARPQIGIGRRRLQIGRGAVFRQQRHQIL